MNGFALYGRYVLASIRMQLAYPASFAMLSLGSFLVTIVEFVGVWALFADAVSRGFDVFGSTFVKTGAFDRLLLRPRSPALQLLGYELRMTRIGRLTQGVLVFWLGLAMTHLHWSPWAAPILLFAVMGGVALFSGLFVMQATLSFWTVESLEVANVLTYGGEAAAEFPLNVYASWFRDILVFAVPIGCVTYLPMLAAIGRADPLGSPAWIGPLAPAAGFLFLGLALFTWRFGIRRYASSGA
jgi:ABC-2 type transport system permease protein